MSGFVCGPSTYEYQGWYFEIHSWIGPWPLKKDGDPRKRVGIKFYTMWEEFNKLSPEEKEACKVYQGGCRRI